MESNTTFHTTNKPVSLYFGAITIIWIVIGSLLGIAISPILLFFIFIWNNDEKYFELAATLLIVCTLSDSRTQSLAFSQTLKAILMVSIFLMNYKTIISLGEQRIDYAKTILPFFIVSLIPLFNGPIFLTSLQKSISYLLVLFTVPNLIYLGYKKEGELIFLKISYLLFVIIIIGNLSVYLPIPYINPFPGDRYAGVFGNPNGIGSFALMSIMFTHYVKRYFPNLLGTKFFYGFNLLLLYNILISGSRTALFSVAIFFILMYPLKNFRGLIFFGLVSLLILRDYAIDLIIAIAKNYGLEEILRIETLETGSGRTIAIEFAWINIQEAFWLGRGMGFGDYLFGTNFKTLSALGHQGSVHNTYFLMWLDVGLIGLIIFFLSYVTIFRTLLKIDKATWPLIAVVFITTLTEVWIVGSLTPWMLTFLLIYSLKKIKGRIQSEKIELESITNKENAI